MTNSFVEYTETTYACLHDPTFFATGFKGSWAMIFLSLDSREVSTRDSEMKSPSNTR